MQENKTKKEQIIVSLGVSKSGKTLFITSLSRNPKETISMHIKQDWRETKDEKQID